MAMLEGVATTLQWLLHLDPSDPYPSPPHQPLSPYGKVMKNPKAHFDFTQIPPNQPRFFIYPSLSRTIKVQGYLSLCMISCLSRLWEEKANTGVAGGLR